MTSRGSLPFFNKIDSFKTPLDAEITENASLKDERQFFKNDRKPIDLFPSTDLKNLRHQFHQPDPSGNSMFDVEIKGFRNG